MKRGMDIYMSMLRSTSRRKLPCDTCKELGKTYVVFAFDFFSWRVPHLPTAPGCIPSRHRAVKCVGWVLSIGAAAFPCGYARSSLHAAAASHPLSHPAHEHLGSDVQESLREREGKGKLSFHICPGAHILELMIIGCYLSP